MALTEEKEVIDGSGQIGACYGDGQFNEFMYVYLDGARAKGEFQVITFDGDEETAVKGVDAATSTVYQLLGVVTETVTEAGVYPVQIKGHCQALVDGTTDVAKDDFLEVINAGVAAIDNGTSRTVNSVAIAREAQTTDAATLTAVTLLGDRCLIAAS